MIVLALIIALLVLLYYSVRWFNDRGLPPGPWGLPLIGYLPFLNHEAHKQLFNMRSKFGNVVSLRLGNRLVVVLLDYSSLDEAYNKSSFSGRPKKSSPFQIINNGISFADIDGEVWRINRRLSLKILRDLGFGKATMEIHIQEEIRDLTTHLESTGGSACDARKALTSSISNNITALIFGRRLELDDPLRHFLNGIIHKVISFFRQTSIHIYLPWMKSILIRFKIRNYDQARDAITDLMNFIDEEIVDHRSTMIKGENSRDFIDGYLTEMDSQPTNGALSIRYLKGNIRSVFVAGSEATRSSMEWSLSLLANHPESQKRIQSEIDHVVGHSREPSMDDRENMPFLVATILEVLRWTGVVPLGFIRETLEEERLQGYRIPKGTIIIPNIWGIHHDPDLWDDPMKFKPDRFFVGSKIVRPDHFVPFSKGQRSCPGEKLAHMELFLYLSSILQKFDVVLVDRENTFDAKLGITLQLLTVNLRFVPRNL